MCGIFHGFNNLYICGWKGNKAKQKPVSLPKSMYSFWPNLPLSTKRTGNWTCNNEGLIFGTAGVLLGDYILTKVNGQVMEIMSWSENPIWAWWAEHFELNVY